MKFRVQAFNRERELHKGSIVARDEEEARRLLGAMGYGCIVQCDPRPSFLKPYGTYPSGTIGTMNPSEQFIPADPIRNVAVRTLSGIEERRLIGHVEKLGGVEYLQLWTCLALYAFTALAMWWFFPPLRELDVGEWLSEEQRERLGGVDPQLYKAGVVAIGNSTFTLLALMITLALKHRLTRIGLTLLAVYAFQWLACSGVLDVEDGGEAIRFMAAYPVYTAVAWATPVVVMVGAERLLRQIFEMTVPVYEDPATGELEAGGRGVRAV